MPDASVFDEAVSDNAVLNIDYKQELTRSFLESEEIIHAASLPNSSSLHRVHTKLSPVGMLIGTILEQYLRLISVATKRSIEALLLFF